MSKIWFLCSIYHFSKSFCMLWAFEHAIARLFWKKGLSMSTKGTVKLTLNIFDTRMSFSCLLYMFLSSRPLFALMLCSIFVNLDQLFVCLKSSKEQKNKATLLEEVFMQIISLNSIFLWKQLNKSTDGYPWPL